MDGTRFLIMFGSEAGERMARIVIESLRFFGGPLGAAPVWAFVLDAERVAGALPGMEGVERIPLSVEAPFRSYPFATKVAACARAEAMAGPKIRSLVWLSLDGLVINPPALLDLGPDYDAAFRPVHHRNIGSLAHEPPDRYWAAVYRVLGVTEAPYTVESFVDGETLRPYFNTHSFAINPARGLAQAWSQAFQAMVRDESFQAGPCRGELHRIFLHQAILGTLVATRLSQERLRLLPSEYSYPLHLLPEMPAHLRATTLNSLVTAVYEDAFPWGEIEVQEPLRTWLQARL